jgi:leader peptidase (prepilin peptidase)/N-methyltransferase
MNENIIYYTIILLYGIVIGSFVNVCIYRIPEGFSIVTGRSHCMKCNSQIKWYDLIPILSYILLLGRCRKCKSKISIQYPIIEALNGLLYVLVFYLYGFNSLRVILISSAYCLVISALLVLSVIDFRTNTIPFGINIFIAVMGLFIVSVKYFMDGSNTDILIDHTIGLLSVSLFLLMIYLVSHGRGIGGGDVKLMGAAGLVLGGGLILLAFMIGCVLAAIIHPIRMKINHLNRLLAFGPYLSAGIIISMLFGKQIVDWYIQSFFF